MRKISLIIFGCFFCCVLLAQSYIYKTLEVNSVSSKNDTVKLNVHKLGSTIVQDFYNEQTSIFKNAPEQRFWWIKIAEHKELIDSPRHIMRVVSCLAIDEDGLQCNLEIRMFKGLEYDEILSLSFKNYSIIYILKKVG
ncbi:MAG TPA: hypothetical protein VKR53_16595 [Puia sp.]|nr:hypothetical protein [Puia sp.]